MPTAVTDRRRQAIAGAKGAAAELTAMGVEVLITGSLARGGFGLHSDVDFLVTCCSRELKYAIEGRVEDALGGLPCDVVYLDEVPEARRARFLVGAVAASDLR